MRRLRDQPVHDTTFRTAQRAETASTSGHVDVRTCRRSGARLRQSAAETLTRADRSRIDRTILVLQHRPPFDRVEPVLVG